MTQWIGAGGMRDTRPDGTMVIESKARKLRCTGLGDHHFRTHVGIMRKMTMAMAMAVAVAVAKMAGCVNRLSG
jgi:hypothetical protein